MLLSEAPCMHETFANLSHVLLRPGVVDEHRNTKTGYAPPVAFRRKFNPLGGMSRTANRD